MRIPIICTLLCFMFGCSDDDTSDASTPFFVLPDVQTTVGDGSVNDMAVMAPLLDMAANELDAAMPVDQGGLVWPTGPSIDVCGDFPPTSTDFQASSGTDFGTIAGDFTVNLLDGTTWQLAQNWTGCESYVFFTYFDLNSDIKAASDVIWSSRVDELFRKADRNVRYFFISDEQDESTRRDRLLALRSRILERMLPRLTSEDELVHWANRFHFVTDKARSIEGSVGDFLNAYLSYASSPSSGVDLGDRGTAYPPLPNMFGIDRFQKLDSGGSLSLSVGQPSSLSMGSYVAGFYNHLARVQQAMTDTPPTHSVSLLSGSQTERHFTVPLELSDTIDWNVITKAEIEIQVHCPSKNPFGCSEWDRIGRIELCRDAACTQTDEIARWITPYWRRGTRRWMLDVSAFISNLKAPNMVFPDEPEGMAGEAGGGGTGGEAGDAQTGGVAGSGGAAGSAGESGNAGVAGSGGAAGVAGPGGAAGSAGESGNAGVAGSGGAAGSAGESGNAGSAGVAGSGGAAGSAGESGNAGSAGVAGSGGAAGAQGADGPRMIRLIMGPNWERKTVRDVEIKLHLRQEMQAIPTAVFPLFRGGAFDEAFDSSRLPIELELPAEINSAKLVYLLSGHGQDGSNSCAEWCAHKHQFLVNGLANLVEPTSPRMTSVGCAELTGSGVVPGQWGNWNQGRAYWCPGLPVPAIEIDVTSQVRAGTLNEFEHRANTPSGSLVGGNIDLSSYLVIY